MDDSKGLSYFFLGLGVGVAVGMIFAPQAGAETRTRIRGRASEGGDYLRRRGSDLREGASGLVERGKTVVSKQRERLNASVEAGKQAYSDTVGKGGEAQPSGASDVGTPAEGL